MLNLSNKEATKKVYEMILSHGVDEEERRLYLSNTESTRKHFVYQMKEFLTQELESLKDFQSDLHVGSVLRDIYDETLHNIHTMQDAFILQGEAFITPYIFFKIEEKLLIIEQESPVKIL